MIFNDLLLRHGKQGMFRTGITDFSDSELSLLDVLFDGGAPISLLKKATFQTQWGIPPHQLDDEDLKFAIDKFVDLKALKLSTARGVPVVSMTKRGGKLWSSERKPKWGLYCAERYPADVRGRSIISVAAVSKAVRDEFLNIVVTNPIRLKKKSIQDPGIIRWHPFGTIHIGVASFKSELENPQSSPSESWSVRTKLHFDRIETYLSLIHI